MIFILSRKNLKPEYTYNALVSIKFSMLDQEFRTLIPNASLIVIIDEAHANVLKNCYGPTGLMSATEANIEVMTNTVKMMEIRV